MDKKIKKIEKKEKSALKETKELLKMDKRHDKKIEKCNKEMKMKKKKWVKKFTHIKTYREFKAVPIKVEYSPMTFKTCECKEDCGCPTITYEEWKKLETQDSM